MSQIEHPMSFFDWFFIENVQKNSIPKCHELRIRCHVYIVCCDLSSRRAHKVRTILIQPKSKQVSCKNLNATNSKNDTKHLQQKKSHKTITMIENHKVNKSKSQYNCMAPPSICPSCHIRRVQHARTVPSARCEQTFSTAQ